MRMQCALILALVLTCTCYASAQRSSSSDKAAEKDSEDPYWHDWKKELYEQGIQDNSFLVEESYNQDYGVVQHINNFAWLAQNKLWVYSFTEEWPLDVAPKNQLSYTIQATHNGAFAGSGAGIGDALINYRYQLVGNGDARVAVAPRFSLVMPSGDSTAGRGAGGVGIQTNWALSFVWNKKLSTHFNAGATIVPHSKDESGHQAATYAYNLGQSFVWTVYPRFNGLIETVLNRSESVIGPAHTQWSTQLLVNPGIRWAYNFSDGLQIVPGISAPLGIGPSGGEKGIFFYLSFEHPYRRVPRKSK